MKKTIARSIKLKTDSGEDKIDKLLARLIKKKKGEDAYQ